nr:immunoglobulin heavy chain junction region [Macaca mulatta]
CARGPSAWSVGWDYW